jgi:membrane fusion protein (multidrug efflux system)
VFSIIQAGELWIEANFKETQLANVRAGQAAIVVADAYPGIEWRARVSTIAPATGAEFALLPPQNATGNWVKIVQRVPVQLAIAATTVPAGEAADRPALRAGMTVTVSVDTGRSRGLPEFLARLAR